MDTSVTDIPEAGTRTGVRKVPCRSMAGRDSKKGGTSPTRDRDGPPPTPTTEGLDGRFVPPVSAAGRAVVGFPPLSASNKDAVAAILAVTAEGVGRWPTPPPPPTKPDAVVALAVLTSLR